MRSSVSARNRKTRGEDITATAFFQKTDYSYSIRGWLTGINDVAHLDESGQPDDLFAFRISYTTTTSEGISGITGPFNGNISETYWRSGSDNVLRKYGYIYDRMNRLEQAIYQKPDNLDPTPDSYNEAISYDRNGNITTLHRTGALDNADMALAIDDLQYAYAANSNRLLKVTDLENCVHGFSDDSDGTDDDQDDYGYDTRGNLISDQNKNIGSILYNHLNLPIFIQFDIPGVNTIEYIYDALGQKVRKKVKMLESGIQKEIVTEYLGGFQYADGNLVFFPTAEGYVRVLDRYNAYVFNYKDHLGNIRVSYAEEPESPGELKIIEENHYYPYGLKHENYNIARWGHEEVDDELVLASASALEYKYKFNGIEWQEELGLNLYDMDFRDYDPAIGRWTGIDPVTHYNMAPYMAFDGNPVYWADPSGADAVNSSLGMLFTGADAGAFFNALKTAMDGGVGEYSVQEEYIDYSTQDPAAFDKVGARSMIYHMLQTIGICNPNLRATVSYNSVNLILTSPEIKKLVKDADLVAGCTLRIDFKSKQIDYYERVNPETGVLWLFPRAFTTWARLAMTIVHGASHRIDWLTGDWNPESTMSLLRSEVKAWRLNAYLGDVTADYYVNSYLEEIKRSQ